MSVANLNLLLYRKQLLSSHTHWSRVARPSVPPSVPAKTFTSTAGLSLEIVNSAAYSGAGSGFTEHGVFKRLRQTTIVSSCNTSLLQLGGNCVLVTACVSADTVSAKAYASHSRLGTCCSCPFYDVYYTMNTTLSTG